MKKIILLSLAIFNCLLLSGCRTYYKSYELIDGKKLEYINDTGIYFEVFGSRYDVHNRNEIKDIFDTIKLYTTISETPKAILLNWYKIELNGELKYAENIEEQLEYKYIDSDNRYHPIEDKMLGKFDLNSKDNDRLTISINITVVSDDKEETKTKKNTYIVHVKSITYLEQKIFSFLSQ